MDFDNASFRRYLSAKKTVDDQSLNPRLWASFIGYLETMRKEGAVRILELGAGIGSMAERIFCSAGTEGIQYVLLDENSEFLGEAAQRLGTKFGIGPADGSTGIVLQAEEAGTWLSRPPQGSPFRVLLANAFLDLVDIPFILELAFRRLEPGGLAYFSINYDGMTDFLPAMESDGEILGHYNASMRVLKGNYSGTDKSFGRIFRFLSENRYPILDSGSSDWVIVPRPVQENGSKYTSDERIVLETVLSMVEASVSASACDAALLAEWMAERRRQMESGGLAYIAHQLDVLARKPL
ncbi:MAG: hypothetical protein A2Z99_10685 [Treponema sp. GWB1_62_6]|nr:MAG: hypothetical protein A2Z99_10685 [Treponema sp. GWB1_62_6]OHE62789.1 MAG: hypothetical protein A2Y36_06230 [Treponema sp. GWA1_62_8]OHE71817.1 MAG: hypothetical protein A2413_04020 [Treponema sp. RIFOXYC1_FULL_61_9]